MADLTFSFGDFSSTSCTVSASTDAGRKFLAEIAGCGAGLQPESVQLPKTRGSDLLTFAERRGLTTRAA